MRKVNEIRIGDRMYSRWFLEQDSGQRALSFAHREKAEVVCLCNNVPMHVAHAKSYFLRRNPGTGSLHATSCPSFTQDDIEVDVPARAVPHQAIERDNSSIKISPAFLVPHFAGLQPPAASPDGLALLNLLRLMWREAGLNIWRDTKVVRDWPFVREKLDGAAEHFILNGNGGMWRFLLIPKSFDANKVDTLTQEREAWLTKFRSPAPGGVFLVAGILKGYSQTRNNNTSIQIKHMAEEQIICPPEIGARLDAASYGGCSVFVLASVKCSGQYLIGDEVALLSVTRNEMLPVAHAADLALTKLLVERGRRFIKPISASGGELDGAFLTDCAGGKRIGFKGSAPTGSIEIARDLSGLNIPASSFSMG